MKITIKHIVYAGLIAGTLDAVAAIIVYQANPLRMFQFIASGAFGNEAMEGGGAMVAAGIIFHYFIATFWALCLFLLYPRMIQRLKNKWITGILYGVIVWSLMNLVVLPLSQIKTSPFVFTRALVGITIIIVAVGIPLGLLADRHFRKRGGVVTS